MRSLQGFDCLGKSCGPVRVADGRLVTPTEIDFEISIESRRSIPDVLCLPMDQYAAWKWYIDRNPMRGYRGTHHLLAHRIAMEATTEDNPVTIADVMWWTDLQAALDSSRNPHDLSPEVLEELRARGVRW